MPASAAASSPHSRRSFSTHVVATHGCPGCSDSALPKNPAGKNDPPAHWPSASCFASSAAPNPSRCDAGTGRLPHLGRGTRQVTFDLPAQGGIGVEQPVEQAGVGGHASTLAMTTDARKADGLS